ncbi:MAG: hypothetical protein LC122_13140 [Chitinophagales bacterium]|nr:hypothetical protein [Chitinophagales bacterium]
MSLAILFSWQFVLLCLGISAVVYIIRLVVEYLLQTFHKKESKLWVAVILPALPIFVGLFFGLKINSYPYPEGVSTLGAHSIFGLVAGLLSGLVYKIVKELISSKSQNMGQLTEDLKNSIVKE